MGRQFHEWEALVHLDVIEHLQCRYSAEWLTKQVNQRRAIVPFRQYRSIGACTVDEVDAEHSTYWDKARFRRGKPRLDKEGP